MIGLVVEPEAMQLVEWRVVGNPPILSVRIDPRKAKIVTLRYFAGLSVEETAEVLKVSPATVRREWSIAKLWLYRELGGGTDGGLGSVEATR